MLASPRHSCGTTTLVPAAGKARMEVARIEADTVASENQRRAVIAQSAAELRVKQAETEQLARMAEIQSTRIQSRFETN